MSVSFRAEETPIIGWDIACPCGNSFLGEGAEPMDRAEVEAQLMIIRGAGNGVLPGCDPHYCQAWTSAITEGPESEEVNMANGNAAAILRLLGFYGEEDEWEDVCCGEASGEELLERILLASAAPELATTVDSVSKPGVGPMVVEFGRDLAYVNGKLEELRAVATFARDHGRQVVWC